MEFSVYPVVAVIPSLNPDKKLIDTVHGLVETGFTDIILVDDGSREECQSTFRTLENLPECQVLHHDTNRGKGCALKTAFSYYLTHFDQEKYCGVVTADADGQHLPKDIRKTAQALVECCGGIYLGSRDFDEKEVPFKSRNGNKITTYVFYLLYGKLIHDTQTGLRAISNDFLTHCVKIRGDRFEYEIRMLVDAVTQNIYIQEVPIQTVYFNDNRETHFHPVMDSLRIYRVMLGTFLRFTGSGLLCMLLDQGLFAVFQWLLFAAMKPAWSIPLSTLLARAISSYLNFTLNRSIVFEKDRRQSAFFRYYELCIGQMAASALGVLRSEERRVGKEC